MSAISRRAFVGGSLAASMAWSLAPTVAPAAAATGAPLPDIQPRSAWDGGLAPTGALQQEAAGDVRFLLVHHTETPNGYGPDAVASRLQNIFRYHTGTKGWPDIAYNFFVDAYGRIWEGRTGSLAGPVRGDATGGSQGYAQLCCFLGSHQTEAPTPAAVAAMSSLTAWLAGRYAIDLFAGPTITFTSRGSNRWPAGTTVTTDPIAGHRDMSQSACPGDAAYPLVRGEILRGAQALAPAATTTSTSTVPATSTPTTATSTSRAPASTTLAPTTSATTPSVAESSSEGSDGGTGPVALAAAATGVAAAAGIGLSRRARSRRRDDGAQDDEVDGT